MVGVTAVASSSPQPVDGTARPKGRLSLDSNVSRTKSSLSSAHLGDSVARSGYLDELVKRTHLDRENTPSSTSTASAGAEQPSESVSKDSASSRSRGRNASGNDELITTRFKHTLTPEGYAVITGRDGATLQRCEDEPIHIPGAVQGFGLLVALQEDAEGKFVVRIVSENSERIIGYSPKALFRLENFCDILSEEQQDNLLDHVDFIRDDQEDVAVNGPEVFILSIRPPGRRTVKLWCALHINDTNPDLIICEFELDNDPHNPLFPAREMTPEVPEDILSGEPTEEEYEESTSAVSKPLRVLRRARKRQGEAAAMEVFNIMSQVQEQLASASSLEIFLKVLVGVVKELTGFHRAMIYQFDSSWNGRVVAELVDPRVSRDFYKGLNFPASDIPKQARDLYKVNRVRLLYDRDQPTARLVCRTAEDLENPLDLTYSYLRAMSPIHLKYLANMAVRSSMSISINAFGELWGLISCHSYGPSGMRVSFPIRKLCRLVGDSASRNIERLSYASRLQARKLINTVPTEHNPSGYIVASSEDLLQLFDADFGILSIRDETKILGKVEQSQEALAMLEYIRLRQITSVLSSHDIREDFPDLRYPPGFQVIAGLLLVPLSVTGEDFIVFFRRSQLKHVRWAGNPYEKIVKEGTLGYLEPRGSFKAWTEVVAGKCREWTEDQVETAAVLCLVYGKFIAVWRQREAALQRSQLTRLLLANSAHEVRTPLNAVINYLEIALEGNLDPDTREYLSKSHSASKSLICVINDLLDLTKAEEGQALIKDEIFDLTATIQEAVAMFASEASRKQIRLETASSPDFPPHVVGDQRRVRQAVSNVLANAIQYTSIGSVKVELAVTKRFDHRVEVDIVVEDTGAGMSTEQLDSLFREMEQVQTEDGDGLVIDWEQLEPPQQHAVTGGPAQKRALGLGLATVARVVRTMDGQLRLKSEEGRGSRFVIQLPFFLPDTQSENTVVSQPAQAQAAAPSTPPPLKGEVMLINNASPKRGASSRPSSIRRQGSSESKQSLSSFKSQSSAKSGMSDVDRFIGVIQEPHNVSTMQESAARRGSHGDRLLQGSPQQQHQQVELEKQAVSHQDFAVPTARDTARSPTRRLPGAEPVQDNMTPLKAVRVRDEYQSPSPNGRRRSSTDKHSQPPPIPAAAVFRTHDTAGRLSVLVAEDDPINSKIVKKRLEKFGHKVTLTVNGEECASVYEREAERFDVILMDMQASPHPTTCERKAGLT